MYSPRALFTKEPVAVSAAVVALVNLLILFGVVPLTAEQVAGIDTALILVLGLFVRQQVTPTALVPEPVTVIVADTDDIPTTGAPEAGQSIVKVLVIIVLLLVIAALLGADIKVLD